MSASMLPSEAVSPGVFPCAYSLQLIVATDRPVSTILSLFGWRVYPTPVSERVSWKEDAEPEITSPSTGLHFNVHRPELNMERQVLVNLLQERNATGWHLRM